VLRRHGTFRPTLPKLVASNSDEKIAAATKDAFTHYAQHPSDITIVLKKLSEPLKGIGPSTASLLLSIHDPANVVFFSDELYRWLCADGKKASPKYTTKEFEELFSKAKAFMSKIKCTPIELEKAAFVIIRENEPVYEPKPKKEPSGLPRGRPAKPDSEKKAKKPTVPGRGRGRPPKTTNGVAPKAAAKPAGEAKKRGRPVKAKVEPEEEQGEDEDEEAAEEEEKTTTPKKRKASEAPTSAKRSGKKAKA